MSYQVLARKWRPSNFSQVAGQGHVLKSLVNALDNERLHHAYLFTGTRGVGKTTLARILAKCLNCEQGVSSTPCEQCDSCKEITQGRFIDLIEVDAASRTKVEDTRELLDNVQYSPTRGRFKVYLIDEVHMLSNHSFNALLKTLEEPPPHVKFLFATTDPQKLPVTILSRCLQFNLKNLSPEIIVNYLADVLKKEEIEADDEALWQIALAATGSMRDALTLVDQAIAYCQGSVRAAGVIEMLGIPEQRQVYDLLRAMAAADAGRLMTLIGAMSEQTPDYAHTMDSLLSVLHRIALAQAVPQAIDNSFGDREEIIELAGLFSAEDIQLYYQIGTRARDELRLASDLRGAFEMLLLRMLLFSPDYDKAQLADAVSPREEAPQEQQDGEKKKTTADAVIPPEPEPAVNVHTDVPGATEAGDQPVERAPDELGQLDQLRWQSLLPQLKVSGIIANVLANTEVATIDGDSVALTLDEAQSAVYSDDLLPRISAAFSEHFGKPIQVTVRVGQVAQETPAQLGQRLRQEQYQQMVNEFEQDANVKELLRRFSGTLARDSVSPLDKN
ncbi:MAG: DNA polymerase III subunit gamma/tau [Pseudohongiellaceae bacterium]